ncbi:MAG: alanine racemase [Actinobacteria bacterium]|nr:alanine racemase [Actinomycetota bacterium]
MTPDDVLAYRLASQLDTPAVVVDLDRLDRNVAAMGRAARDWNVSLRPHIKTHKSRAIAMLQLAGGASGLSTAKLDEAEAMATVCGDLFVAYPIVTAAKAQRVGDLASTVQNFLVGLDHESAVDVLVAAARRADQPQRVLVEVDSGLGRCGVDPSAAGELARRAGRSGWLEVVGVFTHAGHAYRATGIDEVRAAARSEVEAVLRAAQTLPSSDVAPIISVGSTPTTRVDVDRTGVTEVRPGNYVFLDRTQVHLGVATIEECSLSVIATVVSAHQGRAVIDAGSKVFGLDRGGHGTASIEGFGVDTVTGLTVSWLSEEHGVITDPDGRLRVGDRVDVVPNHACVVTNLTAVLYGVRGGAIETTFTIDARGGGR